MSEPTRNLTEKMVSCVKDNDLEQLTQLLSHPLAKYAVRANNALLLRLACVKNRLHCIDAMLPYCTDKEIGSTLHFCLSNLRLDIFDRIVQNTPHSGAYMGVTTLDTLLELHTTRLNTSESPIRLQALERFLDWAPQAHIDQSLAVILNSCQSDPSKMNRIEAFETLVAQRQKQRLEQEIDVGHHAVARKM